MATVSRVRGVGLHFVLLVSAWSVLYKQKGLDKYIDRLAETESFTSFLEFSPKYASGPNLLSHHFEIRSGRLSADFIRVDSSRSLRGQISQLIARAVSVHFFSSFLLSTGWLLFRCCLRIEIIRNWWRGGMYSDYRYCLDIIISVFFHWFFSPIKWFHRLRI